MSRSSCLVPNMPISASSVSYSKVPPIGDKTCHSSPVELTSMRTMDRRDQLLQLLRRRADWTAAGLARELGVSRRTVLRDLGGLREAGFDLATFSGPGGGVRLNPTSIMITSQLRASEVVALIVSVEIARAAKTVPFAAGAQQALDKIERALPAARAAEFRPLAQPTPVGEPPAGANAADIDP